MNDQIIPANLQAETALLGSILIDPDIFPAVKDKVRKHHLYFGKSQVIYEAMLHLHSHDTPIDFTLLINRLEEQGQLNDIGGPGGLTEMIIDTPTSSYAGYYCDLILSLSERRNLIAAGQKIVDLAFSPDYDSETGPDKAVSLITGAVEDKPDTLWTTMGDALRETLSQLDADTRTPPIPTGFTRLDRMLGGGMYRGNSFCIAGRSGMGKTALALKIGLNAALAGYRVGVFSFEMANREVMMRLISMMTGINGLLLRQGLPKDSPLWEKVIDAASTLNRLPIKFNPFNGIEGLVSSTRRLHAKEGIDLCIIDYLQLMTSEKEGLNRNLEIGRITREIKVMATQLDIVAMPLSQLTRGTERTDDRRPQLHHLRDSGSIEQDQDVVLGAYRADYYDHTDSPGKAELILLKHRQGPTGTVIVNFDGHTTNFRD